MKRSVLCLLLASILLLSMTACIPAAPANSVAQPDAATPAPTPGAAEEPAAQPEQPASGEKVTFEFYQGVGGNMSVVLEGIIDDFNASQDQYICKSVPAGSYNDSWIAYQAALAAKQPPALILGVGPESASTGIYEDWNKYINADPAFPREDYVDVYIKQGEINGQQLLMPGWGTGWMVFYDFTLVEEAGLDESIFTTWDDLVAAADTLVKREGGETTRYVFEPMWGYINMYDAVLSYGGKVLSDDGKTALINDETWVFVWEQFRKWIHDDQIMRIHHGGSGWEYWYKTMDDMKEGRAIGYMGTAGDLAELDWSKTKNLPQPGWKGIGPARPETPCIKIAMNLTSTDAEKQGAYEFYKYLTTIENAAKWSMETGYIPSRKSAKDDPTFAEFLETHEYMYTMFKLVETGSVPFVDPTGGKLWDALEIACDKVQIENISAKEALDEAAEEYQAELDKLG